MLHLATNDIRVYSEFSIEGIQERRGGRAGKAQGRCDSSVIMAQEVDRNEK